MKKINLKSKAGKMMIYTFLILNLISFASFVPSKAKYFNDKKDALSFSAGIYKLYKENRIIMGKPNYDLSTLDTAHFIFSFPRNDIGEFDEKDVYEVVLPKGCKVSSIASLGVVSGNTVTYASAISNSSRVAMQCNVDDIIYYDEYGQKYLDFDIVLRENIDEEGEFVYTDLHYRQLYSVYVANLKQKPSEPLLPIFAIENSDTNKYQTFINWMEAYGLQENAKNEVLTYVKSQVIEGNDESIINVRLPGLTVQYDSASDSYIYTVSDNFIGYATMYTKEVPSFMFFSTEDEEELQIAFEFYLKEFYLKDYQEPVKTQLFELVVAYVKSFDGKGISYMILPDEAGNYREIPGLVRVTDTGKEVKQILINDTIFDYAYNKLYQQVRVSFDSRAAMMNNFLKSLPFVYDEEILSKETINSLTTAYRSLIFTVVRNNNDTDPVKQSFSEYFIVEDTKNGHNVLLNVYSHAGEEVDNQFNYVIASKIDYDNFTFTQTNSQFRVNAKEESMIRDFVQALDVRFGQTTVLTDDSFTRDAYGMLSVLYTIEEKADDSNLSNDEENKENNDSSLEDDEFKDMLLEDN